MSLTDFIFRPFETIVRPLDIPYGRFVYIEDPDGNSIGLFEPKAA